MIHFKPLASQCGRLFFLVTLAVAILFGPPNAYAQWDVAPLEDAVTLARVDLGGQIHTLAVVQAEGDEIIAVDLSEQLGRYPVLPLDVLEWKELDEIASIVQSAPDSQRTIVPIADLLPVATSGNNIAAGTNYAEHGEEASIDTPFLFPKIADPTPHGSALALDPEWLLDYEVELAVVFDRDIQTANDLQYARAGFFVVNDFTERATLLREADLSDPSAGHGFANAKGQPGFLPTGPWLIVPRGDWREAYQQLQIKLTVNGEERQNESADQMIWDVDQIIAQTFKTGGKGPWSHRGDAVSLYENSIEKGTAILTGTPGGVVFNAPGMGYITVQGLRWVFSFSFTGQSLLDYMAAQLEEDLQEGGTFLQAGDKVVASGTSLGSIDTEITAP